MILILAKNRLATHPGEIVLLECLEPLEVSIADFADKVELPLSQVKEFLEGRSPVTPDLAWRLYQTLGSTPQFWLRLQYNYDLSVVEQMPPPCNLKRIG